jgi:hypothetical protein
MKTYTSVYIQAMAADWLGAYRPVPDDEADYWDVFLIERDELSGRVVSGIDYCDQYPTREDALERARELALENAYDGPYQMTYDGDEENV